MEETADAKAADASNEDDGTTGDQVAQSNRRRRTRSRYLRELFASEKEDTARLSRCGGDSGRREHCACREHGGDYNAQHRAYELAIARSSAASNVSASYESSCLLPLT